MAKNKKAKQELICHSDYVFDILMILETLIAVRYNNRSPPSSKNPHFQNEAKCTTFPVKMSLICLRMENHLHIKG